MKSCSECNRTYDDDLFFCLEDGHPLAPLRVPHDQAETLVITEKQAAGVKSMTPIQRRKVIMPLAAILLIMAGLGIAIWITFDTKQAQTPAQEHTSSPTVPSSSELSKSYRPSLAGCTNLLRNGTFDGSLNGWRIVNYTSGAVTELASRSTLRMHHNNARDWSSVSQEIRSRLHRGNTYVLSFKYQTSDPVKIGFRFTDSSSVMHSTGIRTEVWELPLIADGGWHSEAFEFDVTLDFPKPDEPMFGIVFDYNNTGTVLIDDVLVAVKHGSCG